MPRIRSIHYDAWKSKKLAQASDGAERCYWRIQPYVDDEGRGEDEPKLIAATVFPFRDEASSQAVDAWLEELHNLGLVVRYDAGQPLLQVVEFKRYQHPQRPKPSEYPPPPDGSGTRPRGVRDASATDPLRRGGEWSGAGLGVEGESEGEARARANPHCITCAGQGWILDEETKCPTCRPLADVIELNGRSVAS